MQSEQSLLVESLIRYFVWKECEVLSACAPEYVKCRAYGKSEKHIPDVVAKTKSGRHCIGMAIPSFSNDERKQMTEKISEFANARVRDQYAILYIGIPRFHEDDLLDVIHGAGLQNRSNIEILLF